MVKGGLGVVMAATAGFMITWSGSDDALWCAAAVAGDSERWSTGFNGPNGFSRRLTVFC